MSATVRKPAVAVRQLPPYEPDLDAWGLTRDGGQIVPIEPCPDLSPAEIMRSSHTVLNARLFEGRFDRHTGRLIDHRLTPVLDKAGIVERYRPLRETLKLSEADWFTFGGYHPGAQQSPLTATYTPMIPGPSTRQQYWADYWASSAKSFEASTHSGIARRCCEAMVNFPLARGVQWKIPDQAAQTAWEQFWDQNNMGHRIRQIAYDLAVFGEQFIRYFPAQRGEPGFLVVRQLDPATIYEIVTDQEDLETVYFYQQQFQTRMELYSPPAANRAPEGPTQPGVTRYVIRQIPAEEIDHVKIHTVAGEARGRSDLFPILGDLKRLRDLLTSKVVQADLGTRMFAVLKGNGTLADLQRVLNTFFPNGQPPAPGTAVAINDQVELDAFQFDSNREVREDFTYEELIDSIVAGTGLSRAVLGLSPAQSSGTTQATALTGETAPGKTFEDRQLVIERLLRCMFDRVMAAAGIQGADVEFIFPEITKEDRSAKLKDLAFAEGMGWISGKTAASSAAGELGFNTYDFDEEMRAVAEEFSGRGDGIARPMILNEFRQVPRLDPTQEQQVADEPAGLLVGPGGAQVQGQFAQGNVTADADQRTTGGLPASKAPGTQRAREADPIRRTPEDGVFGEHVTEYERAAEKNLRDLVAELAE